MDVAAVAFLSVVGTSTISFLVLLGLKLAHINVIPQEQIMLWVFLVPLGVLITGISQILYYWFTFRQNFKKISSNSIIKSLSSNLLQVSFYLLNNIKQFGLIVGQTLGNLAALFFYVLYLFKTEKETIRLREKGALYTQALRYKKFPLITLPSSLINVIANQLPVIMLSGIFGPAIVGQYALTQRLLGVPGSLLRSSILGVFKERASRDYRENKSCRDIYVKTLKSLTKLSIIPFIILFIVTPTLIPLIFGSEWQLAGKYAQILSIMFMLKFIASPLSYVLIVAEKQATNLGIQLTLLAVTIVSIVMGKQLENPTASIFLFSGGYSIIYILTILITYKISKGKQYV